jgi:hypothetical protein
VNIEAIDQILSDALHALGAAQAELRKNASARELGDVLRKSDLLDALPRASVTEADRVLAKLAEANARLDRLEAGRDCDAQTRKTWTVS